MSALSLSRWNPFKSFAPVNPALDFDDMFRGLGMRPSLARLESFPEFVMDVSEDPKQYIVKAEMPGVRKEDIEVSIEGREVSIGAEMRRESEKKEGEVMVLGERYYGRVFRSFMLPMEVDEKTATASYDNGVLTLMLPKSGDVHGRRIMVS